MLRTRTTAALAATLLGSIALGTADAHADPPPTSADPSSFAVSPTSGPVGTTITLSGEDCVDEDGPGFMSTMMFRQHAGRAQWANFTTWFDSSVADPDGSWSITASIPSRLDDSLGGEPTPADTYRVAAFCHLGDREVVDSPPAWQYTEASFEVTPSPATSSTTTTTAPPVTTPPVVAPPAATPIVDEPPYNG